MAVAPAGEAIEMALAAFSGRGGETARVKRKLRCRDRAATHFLKK